MDRRLVEVAEATDSAAIQCNDSHCNDPEHLRGIDSCCDQLIKVALEADRDFPRKRHSRRNLCGWQENVKEYKEDSQFWHQVWRDGGKPREGWLFEMMRDSKRQYHYAVRRLKRRQKELKELKFAEAVAGDNARDFFAEVKRLNPKPEPMNLMNGEDSEESIANIFRVKYESLYNSVPSDLGVLDQLEVSLNRSINDVERPILDWRFVNECIKKLKHCKDDGDVHFNSSHLLFSSRMYVEKLTGLLNAMYVHGVIASQLLHATIMSIPKDLRKSLCDDSNYRGIALCSSIAKLFDVILLRRNCEVMKSDDNQFAFKRLYSTSMCTYVLKETVTYFLNRGSSVYACFLDATKAFDRVRYDHLFQILVDKGVHVEDLRLLLYQYRNQKCRASWKQTNSVAFSVTNGVRQGSIASPVLFCLYLDTLFTKLRNLKIGCHVNDSYFGCLGYADDLVLLSPSVHGLRRMLKECEMFCEQSELQFNASKTVCVWFRKRLVGNVPRVYLDGKMLEWSDEVRHLGNIIMYNLSEQKEINVKRGDLVGRTNVILSNLAFVSPEVKVKIFMAQCAHFYGCQAWNLGDPSVKSFCTMYNRCVRRILDVPYRTHTRYIPVLTGRASAVQLIRDRSSKFIDCLLKHETHISFLARLALADHRSILCSNWRNVRLTEVSELSMEDQATAVAIHELLFNPPAGLSRMEAHNFACTLCVN